MGLTPAGGVTICEDNQGCMKLAANTHSHGRTKHIDVRHHFVRELVSEKIVILKYIQSKKNISDILTKVMAGKLYTLLAALQNCHSFLGCWVRRFAMVHRLGVALRVVCTFCRGL
jgi:hypothetical protein